MQTTLLSCKYYLQHEQPGHAQLDPQAQLAPHGQLPQAASLAACALALVAATPLATKAAASANEANNLTTMRKLLVFLGDQMKFRTQRKKSSVRDSFQPRAMEDAMRNFRRKLHRRSDRKKTLLSG
jgi:hypothetical protein